MASLADAGAHESVEGGHSLGRKSYAQIISATKPPPTINIRVKAPSFTDSGESAVFFSREEVRGGGHSSPLKKTWRRKPPQQITAVLTTDNQFSAIQKDNDNIADQAQGAPDETIFVRSSAEEPVLHNNQDKQDSLSPTLHGLHGGATLRGVQQLDVETNAAVIQVGVSSMEAAGQPVTWAIDLSSPVAARQKGEGATDIARRESCRSFPKSLDTVLEKVSSLTAQENILMPNYTNTDSLQGVDTTLQEVFGNASHPLRLHILDDILNSVHLTDDEGRCSARFDSKEIRLNDIIRNIKHHIRFSLHNRKFKTDPTQEEHRILHSFGFHPFAPPKQLKLVRWIPPIALFSLNVDGASKGNPGQCGGGGCIRDTHGNVLVAFAHFYGVGNSLIAETRAFCDGLHLAKLIGCSLTAIYCDSLSLVNSLQQNKCTSWHIFLWWREVRSILSDDCGTIHHVFRESNQVAYRLANHALTSMKNETFWGANSLPHICKGPMIIDKTSLMHVRLV
ncbi:hypothetical protein Taro_008140 [Colocasia esculenta]|uniref:RNase H type-1 domain-containing protein n=1 Tax=Colocasia esculenta TaxID=4460 RepID=A0A843U2A8_COLES|nr:hypothetical protein [Colocasia esculenta]